MFVPVAAQTKFLIDAQVEKEKVRNIFRLPTEEDIIGGTCRFPIHPFF